MSAFTIAYFSRLSALFFKAGTLNDILKLAENLPQFLPYSFVHSKTDNKNKHN